MSDNIRGIISELPKDMIGKSETPVAKHLFDINKDNLVKLNDEQAEFFHHATMQCMYLIQCGRPDICMAISFLSSRVRCPNEDDYKKLAKSDEVLTTKVRPVSTLIVWWIRHNKSVGGCIIQCAPKHAWTHGCHYVHGV